MTEFNDLSSLPRYLASRRSGRPRDMIAPGPDAAQIREIVRMALRTPDHGKLNPWRVVHVASDRRDAFAAKLTSAYRAEKPEAGRLEIEAMETFARQAPELLVVLYSPRESSKIPLWEQQLSAGAFVMNLLHAVHAHSFVGGWITGWPSYSDAVRDLFGVAPEQIAGFVFVGSSSQPLEERPRPELDAVLSAWVPGAG
ncbi:nitroreductase [Blastomonas natatoria]|uniref:Putative NAD(P)H nitroreductase n=1 Tax=Blastomonas natatoria TaxID=34015 RepID=A0A2V3VBA4_9SPHN|nr:nitroreductase [Blastomonas natatoria]PXW79096.1 nitroreductase [Blastomonas natatoria]